ncbi:hypothetical protein EYB53_004640 [Candidatus Chloroploca sp. M-50]|uniref:Histidine kinase/HSP90-like ATPase domain-containing protein n=1 Tax=Candidatus Chloroploca mongolica TaxID=2528176 RepID=A0ABS4D6C4_9CHLR|nr:ATP-binding protein [Candidatus Chloroploca mongolica]MBP1464992.1 hypothetical protein [Candidatus Chloroploca mongolica]
MAHSTVVRVGPNLHQSVLRDITALPGQPGTITITGVREASRAIMLTVVDTGAGLPADREPSISSTMGLQIIYALASQIGGKLIWQHSPGTTVTLRIPESTA